MFNAMSIATIDKPLTYEEERGKPVPSFNHGAIQTNLAVEFTKNRSFRTLSEQTLEINGKPYTPDLSVYPHAPLNLRHDIARSTQPPLLVVEILSPHQGVQELMDKVEVYFAFGVKSCWVVSPSMHSIQILTTDGRETVLNSGTAADLVTGLSADLTAVFS